MMKALDFFFPGYERGSIRIFILAHERGTSLYKPKLLTSKKEKKEKKNYITDKSRPISITNYTGDLSEL